MCIRDRSRVVRAHRPVPAWPRTLPMNPRVFRRDGPVVFVYFGMALKTAYRRDAGRDLIVEHPDGTRTVTSHPSKAAAHRAAAEHLAKNGGKGKLVITDPGNPWLLAPVPA